MPITVDQFKKKIGNFLFQKIEKLRGIGHKNIKSNFLTTLILHWDYKHISRFQDQEAPNDSDTTVPLDRDYAGSVSDKEPLN